MYRISLKKKFEIATSTSRRDEREDQNNHEQNLPSESNMNRLHMYLTITMISNCHRVGRLQAVVGLRGTRHVVLEGPRLPSARCIASNQTASPETGVKQESWKVKMLYDGDCMLCMREVNMLKNRDTGNICFVDIASPDYEPAENLNITFEQAMERIHVIYPDGKTVTDIQAFKALYEQVGLGWVYACTSIPLIERALNKVYGVWAKYRLPITGRPELDVILQEKKMCRKN